MTSIISTKLKGEAKTVVAVPAAGKVEDTIRHPAAPRAAAPATATKNAVQAAHAIDEVSVVVPAI